MGEETKKISFGFSKLSKKTSIVSSKHVQKTKQEESNIQFIEGFESNSVKLKDPIKSEEKILVIPLKRPLPEAERAKQLIQDSSRPEQPELDGYPKTCRPANELCTLDTGDKKYGEGIDNNLAGKIPQQENLTLDELAAKEILEDLNKEKTKSEAKVVNVPLSSADSSGEKESTLDDYENVPVGDFGLAMLRGMGWTPGKGIGKNEKLVAPAVPLVRPKGMGLGADKVIKMPSNDKSATEDDLKMSKGSFIQVIAGPHKDCYGQIEGFADESGRAIVKLAVKNETVSLSEFMFQLVSKSDFSKNAKVVNVAKYEQYKKAEEANESMKALELKDKSSSRSPKEHEDSRSYHSTRTPSSSRVSHKKHSSRKPVNRCHRSSSSSSGKSSASSSSEYSRTNRRRKKKPSSHRVKSRSRSRSPRRNKHKKKR